MVTVLGSVISLVGAAVAVQAAPTATDQPTEAPDPAAIIITGTRIQTPNRKSVSPVETVRPEDFELTGVANVEQTLNQFPQLVPSLTTTSNNPGTGAATLDLRGLGSVRTLILVNGRRWIANDAGNVPEIDVNTIPSALIDRVDIVTGGASAVYGSDAVTGVINFVLKSKLRGMHLEVRNNISGHHDGRVSSADLSYGTSFLKERGNVLASIGVLDQTPILQGARAFSSFTLVDGCVVPGTANRFGASQPAPSIDLPCAPGTEFGLFEGGSGVIPEGAIGAGVSVFFPSGGDSLVRSSRTRFTPEGGLIPFNAGTDSYNYAPANYLQVPLQRFSANLLSSVHISDGFEPYTELSYIRTRSPQQLAPAPGFLGGGEGTVPVFSVNLDNPFLSDQAREALEISFGRDAQGNRGFIRTPSGFVRNPAFGGDADGNVELLNIFGSPGIFFTRLTGLGPRQLRNRRDAYRALVGARGQLTKTFQYDAYFSHSDVQHDKPLINSASSARLQQAILARRDPATGVITCIDPSGGCVPVNVFGLQDISSSAADFIRANPEERTRVKEDIAEVVVRGPLLTLPAGEMGVAAGLNWRRTSFVFSPDRSLEEGDNLGFGPATGAAGQTRVAEIFGEALVPLLADRRFAKNLSMDLGLRYSHYDTVGGVFTWKAMGSWAPVTALTFRGGLQRAVRAPNVRELFEEPTVELSGVLDPCSPVLPFLQDAQIAAACIRNGAGDLTADTFALTLVRTSGSTNLKPEKARTVTFGAALTPWRSVTMSIDYYDIDIRDAIGGSGGARIFGVFGCLRGGGDPASPLCAAFQRAPDGSIAFADLRTANLARVRARGIDWQIAANRSLGFADFNLNLSGTRLLNSEIQFNPQIDPVVCAGSFGVPCGSTIVGTANPQWKLYNRASLTRGPVRLTVRHRFFSSTRDATFAAAEALNAGELEVPEIAAQLRARHYFDAAVTFNITKTTGLTFGVNNLGNAKPSLVGSQQIQANTDPSLYDVIGRRFFISLSARLH